MSAPDSPVLGNAWLLDGDGEVWVLMAPDPAGTGMAVYEHPADFERSRPLRALAIEDEYGISVRGPLVTFVPAATR